MRRFLDVRTALLLAGVLASVPLGSACKSDAPEAGVTVRDSAGVRIIESRAPTWVEGEGWIVGAEPSLDLATTGEGVTHEFYQVEDALRLDDGMIVVATRTDVRYYTSSGTHVTTLGREGEGPGEFRRITALGVLAPESLVVFDYRLRRATVYNPDRTLSRVFRLGVPYPSDQGFGVLGDGFAVMEFWPFSSATRSDMGPIRKLVPVVAVSRGGEILDTVVMIPGYENLLVPTDDGFYGVVPVLGREAHLEGFRDELFLGDAIDLEFRVWSADRTLERIVRGRKDLTLQPELFEAELEVRYGPNPSPDALRLMNEIPRPSRLPAYRDLVVDKSGAVWLAEHRGRAVFDTSPAPSQWEVFDHEGIWLGQVSLPGRFRPLEIGVGYVLGVYRDELDVERVQMLPLHR